MTRGWLYRPSGVWTVRILTLAATLGIWQAYASGLNRALLAPPSEVAQALWEEAVTVGNIWPALGGSLLTLVSGFGLSMLVGVPLGIAMGRARTLEYVIDPYVSFLYALPHVALVPLMVIWFGFNLQFRLAYVFVSAVFPAIINTMVGVKNVDQELLDAGRAFCASERQVLRTIVLPSAVPYIFAGGRQALSSAWVGVVVSEILAALTGVGRLIVTYGDDYKTANMLVPIVVIMGIAVAIQSLTAKLQGRITRWQAVRNV
ncbi:MAG TPA: ABC transporter permease [Chloroflexota bacterium]|nr:ABC transporter permease [Chloroflexota bacterium]